MRCAIEGIQIRAISTALPEKVVKVDTYTEFFGEKKVKRLKKSTGVESVHVVSEGETAADLCMQAAEKIFSQGEITRESIDGIVFASISPDYKAPGTAGIIQGKLGLSSETVTIDLTFGCSAYVYGLYEACLLLRAGGCKRVLLCTGDTQSILINEKDRSMKMLIGDAGAATILENGNSTMNFYLKSVGEGFDNLIIPAGSCRNPSTAETRKVGEPDEDGNVRSQEDLFMNGTEIMKFSLTEVPLAIDAMCERLNWTKDDVDLFAFHQPNKLILDYLRQFMKITEEKCPTGLQNTGNTAAASIPLLLTTLKERGFDFSQAKRVIACGFGIGLSIGATNLDLRNVSFYS